MKRRRFKTRFFVWLLGVLAVGMFLMKEDCVSATEISSKSIGRVFSETENGNSVVGINLNMDGKRIAYAYDVWQYTKDSGWQFQYVNVEGEKYTIQSYPAVGKYIMGANPNGSNNRFIIVMGILKNHMPECYKIETVRFQMGKEISREYEYSDSNALECVSSEYSLQLALLQNTNIRYGGCNPQEVSCEYSIYSGLEIGENGDVTLNATGASIVGKGVAYYMEKGYMVESLPTAEKPQDKYSYEFDGWYTQAEGGKKIEEGDIVQESQLLYAHWKAVPVQYEVTCIDVLEGDYETVLGTKSRVAEYSEVVSGASFGSDTGIGVYYSGREYSGCSSAIVGIDGAKVYRYFRNSNMTVTCIDLVQIGPEAGNMLGTNIWEAPYTSVVSGGAIGCNREIGRYYKGYQYIAATTQTVDCGGCTVYRYFVPIQYEIQFIANCASGGSMATIKNCYYGHSYTLTKNSFLNRSKITLDFNAEEATCDTSYQYVYQEFAGWAESPNGDVMYSDQCDVIDLCDSPSVKKLYAIWSDKEAIITAQPKRLGYEFAGWSRNPEAETGKNQFQILGNETLYAVWKPAPVKYHIQHYKQKLDQSFELETEYELSAYTNEEIVLADLEEIYPGFWLDTDSSSLKGKVKADGSLVLTAYFRRGEYSISFDYNGGENATGVERIDEIEGVFEEEVLIPEINLSKQGYEFAGWGTKPDSKQVVAKNGEAFLIPNHDQVLYAVWLPRKDTVFTLIPYFENVSGTGYIQGEAITLCGATDSSVKSGICDYYSSEFEDAITKMIGKGYQLVSNEGLEEKKILADGTTVVAVYFNRERYHFVYEIDGQEVTESEIIEEIVLYGQIYCFPSDWKKQGVENVSCYMESLGAIYYPGDMLQVTGDAYFSIVEEIELPDRTEEPQTTELPSITKEPQMTELPVESERPEISEGPSTSNTSEPEKIPEVSQTPEPDKIPQESESPQSGTVSEENVSTKDGSSNISVLANGIAQTPNPEEVTSVLEANKAKILPKKGKSIKKANLIYRVTQSTVTKKTVKVIGSRKNKKKIVIPSSISINGYSYKVTAIGKKAFSNQKKLRQVVVGNNIKKIEKKAFAGNSKLKKVVIRTKNIKSIGKDVWKGISKKCSFQYTTECSLKSRKVFQKTYQEK